MRIGILGSGLMGGKLGTIFARAGHDVVFSYACTKGKLEKKVAAQLISDVGFEPIDAGPLRIARYTEPFTMLVGQLAYEGSRGPALAYRFEWFEEREVPVR